jgi:hypothetical protein
VVTFRKQGATFERLGKGGPDDAEGRWVGIDVEAGIGVGLDQEATGLAAVDDEAEVLRTIWEDV